MHEEWRFSLKNRLLEFFKELKEVSLCCGRKPGEIGVLFATKYLDPRQFATFLSIAYEIDTVPVIVGENRVQDAEEKFDFIKEKHPQSEDYFVPVMIGTLQQNKINKAIRLFREIHSVDSLNLALALNERLAREKISLPVFLEINVANEETKHGVSFPRAEELILAVRKMPYLQLKGLMAMAPLTDDRERIRAVFRSLRKLADKHSLLTSMGMSHDWQIAIEEGTDMIRVGRRIFS